MLNLFIQTFKLNNSIFSNTIIYQIRSLPFVKKFISNKLYGNEGISAFLSIICLFINMIKTLASRFFYLLCISLIVTFIFDSNKDVNFAIIFILLSMYGALFNNKVLMATKDKYYAVILMRIDGNKFAKMSYVSGMISLLITSLISLLIIYFIFNFSFIMLLLSFLFIVPCKTIGLYLTLKLYQSKKSKLIEKSVFNIGFAIIILLCITGLVILNIPTLYFYIIITIISILFFITICLPYIMKSTYFNVFFKKRLTLNNIIFDYSKSISVETKKSVNKQINLDKEYHSDKQGYDLFNDIFIQRHKKILTNLVNKFAAGYAVIIIIIIVATYLYPQMRELMGSLILTKLASISFVMYFTNRGDTITRAMFINCDSSMLNYRFYRRSKDILTLFKLRLKSTIILNLRPAVVLAVGIPIILFISGSSSNPIEYISIFVFIIALSIFFSVHHLVLYYLLQPYNISMQAKGTLYGFISSLTYILCYASMQITVDTFIFSVIVSIFCILYIIIASRLAYKHAYKTFKIRQ